MSDDDHDSNWRSRIPGTLNQNPTRPIKNRQDDLNSKIMLTAIISLSVVVAVVILLHLYARYVLRRQARRRAAIRQLGLTISQFEPPKTGLDPGVIASLPIFVFKAVSPNDDDEREAETECAVCLSSLEDGEMARVLPNCRHTFHVACIDRWLSSQSTCPICRTEAEPRPVPESPLAGGAPPTAPPLEGTSEGGGTQSTEKVCGSNSRLSSFRRMLSRERSSRRLQSCGQEDGPEDDLERQ
ncbi:RING/U-box superfamily protein [Actinidia rufa]|uniref:RING-type E3 ubiquitin transferase n=1 Tax=Actinidia rufa TaxID=165716 RepID=A0A7J0DHH6_9ERIC|nr:RING/U-box superfamily protein [Actinidia rufa]